MQELEVAAGSADAITLLSVCKWIHLHAGDRGLKAVFKKLAAALAPGGVLVVEPQPWKSYNQAFRKQVGAAAAWWVPGVGRARWCAFEGPKV